MDQPPIRLRRSPVWRNQNVNPKQDKHAGYENAAYAGQPGCFFDVSTSAPKNRAQHAAAVKRIAREEIEKRQQQISRSDQKENHYRRFVISQRRDLGANKSKQGKQETGGRTRNGNAKFGARVLRFSSETSKTAKRMKYDLFNLNSFRSRH
jgi:hypothetical protein